MSFSDPGSYYTISETESGEQKDDSTALLSATVKGIEVTIQRRCPSCQFKQKVFVEKSQTHRFEGCRLKQASLTGMLNDAEAIEDHFLQSATCDLPTNIWTCDDR